MENSLPLAIARLDELLRSALLPHSATAKTLGLRSLVSLVAAGGALMGAAMGSFPAFNGGSLAFVLLSAFKLPLFLALAAALTFPAMRVLYTLWGLGHEFPLAVRALTAGQAVLTAILAALAPFTLLGYVSGLSYRGALLWNVGLFALAGCIAQRTVREHLRDLVRRDARHLRLWQIGFAMWAFIAVQLAWNLRPFIGSPDIAPQFFRSDAFTNVYMNLWTILVS